MIELISRDGNMAFARQRRTRKGNGTGGEEGVRTMRIRSNETVKTQSGLAGIVNNNDMELI